MLKRLKAQGITIIVSTPYMDEATLCERIALIQGGKILSIDTPANIVAKYPDELYAIKGKNMYALLKKLQGYEATVNSYAFGEFAHASFKGVNQDAVKNYLSDQEVGEVEIHKVNATIEDCFIKLLKA